MKRTGIAIGWVPLALAALAAPADAAQITFCIKHTANYVDSGSAGEDFWTTNTARDARGAYFEVYKLNTVEMRRHDFSVR